MITNDIVDGCPRQNGLEKNGPKWSINDILSHQKYCLDLYHKKKLILLLDLDHTLIHCRQESKCIEYLSDNLLYFSCLNEGKMEKWKGRLRPGIEFFFESLLDKFDIYIYTNSIYSYAECIEKYINFKLGKTNIIKKIFARNEFSPKKRVIYVLPTCTMTIAVDDNGGSKKNIWEETDNLVEIAPFKYFGKNFKKKWKNDHHLTDTLQKILSIYEQFFIDSDASVSDIISMNL